MTLQESQLSDLPEIVDYYNDALPKKFLNKQGYSWYQ